MCGFCGYALHDPEGRADAELLARMSSTIAHRGPDDGREWVSGPVGVGFRRLSIIDLEGGWQPIENETGDIAVVANGEIYNFQELRAELEAKGHRFRSRSDCETIVHLYEECGVEFVHRLVGMYAFAVLDRRGGGTKVVLGRDRLGIKPMYFAETGSGLSFGSEPKTILERGEVAREARPEALLDYLVQGYVGGDHSAWAGVRRVPPGSYLTWEPGGRAEVTRYWDMPTDGLRGPVEQGEVLEWLDRVVSDRLVADVPLGAFLSGGIDSTSVVDSMTRVSPDPVSACSVGFRERSHDELSLAEATAERLELVHHTEVLEADPALAVETLPWFFDEPHADPSTVPTFLVSRMAREHVTVALSGDGGDETFAGYRRYVHDVAENRLRRSIGGVGRGLAGAVGSVYPRLDWAPRYLRAKTFLTNVADDPGRAYFRSVSQLDVAAARELLAPDLRARLHDHDPYAAFAAHYERPTVDDPLYRAQYADIHTYLPDQILAKVDRASMAVSLEVRVPILDHRFIGRFANLPVAEKVAHGRGKHAFREALRGRLPASILDGQKRGFDTPLRAWIRGPLRAAVADSIATVPGDWLDRPALERALEQHTSGVRDHGRLLWSVLVLEQWRRRHGVRGLAA